MPAGVKKWTLSGCEGQQTVGLMHKIVYTVSALIKAPLKINYDPREAPSLERKKFLRGLGGALFREAPSN